MNTAFRLHYNELFQVYRQCVLVAENLPTRQPSSSKYSSFWNQILPIDGYVGTFGWEELEGDTVSRQCIRSSREREMDR
jgi:hypothetical protein